MKNFYTFSALFGAYVFIIHTFDGPWKKWTKKGQAATFDTWTTTHFIWGGIAREFNVDLKTFTLLGIGNEFVESYFRKIKFLGLWGEPEAPVNMIIDVASAAAGWKAWDIVKS